MKFISENYINLLIEGTWDNEDPHKVLGVKKDASEQEIRTAHKKLALKHHPDKGGDVEMMKKINDAKERALKPEGENIFNHNNRSYSKPTGDWVNDFIRRSTEDPLAHAYGYRNHDHREEENAKGNYKQSEHETAKGRGFKDAAI